MSVPDVKLTASRLSAMDQEDRAFLLSYVEKDRIVGRRVSDVVLTINGRWSGRAVASMLIDTLHRSVLTDCGPKLRYSPATGEFTERNASPAPIKCPVKACGLLANQPHPSWRPIAQRVRFSTLEIRGLPHRSLPVRRDGQ